MVIWYNILDTETGSILYTNLRAGEIERIVGIPGSYASSYAEKGLIYKGKYRIQKIGPMKSTFCEEWDQITEQLRKYPNIIRRIRLACAVDDRQQDCEECNGR